MNKRKKWTEREIEILKDLYCDCNSPQKLAKLMGRDIRMIYHKANMLGLKRNSNSGTSNKAFVQKGKLSRFKKGHIPWNKGTKGINIGGVNTQFKPGHIPHNTKYDGHERINVDGYIEIRVSMGVYKLKHRVIWEQHKGPIPENMIIKFIDKNPMNTSIDNLYLCTREENMNANTIHRYPGNLKKSMKLIKKLQHEISEYR